MHDEDSREAILRAATLCFGRSGYHGAHVAEIAHEAGMAEGTLYRHFESKHALFHDSLAASEGRPSLGVVEFGRRFLLIIETWRKVDLL